MAKKRVFIAFAVEDKTYRDFLVGQAKHAKTPFDFVDMSVKEPWDAQWKTNCRTRVKGCDGVIALISKHTANADGELWEIKCAERGSNTYHAHVGQWRAPNAPRLTEW